VQHYGGMVNRLIRTQYGPFKLDKIESGEMIEVPQKTVALLVHNLKADGSLK
jgi:16S rRNA U516 pseudouridylate synthase RsuA-like enzyme